ncbi:MAG: S-layer homology domain-containing protein [Oscillospiraceae bacterium]
MKKFLALVLALVMTMSLVTIGASAKTDFTDDAQITNSEAVEVLNAMGVLTGYADGSFRPQATLTRGAGAKIIAYLVLGQTAADKLQATYTVFEDVTDSVGLAPYIEWAAAAGIVDGYGDGKFGPYNTLTEYAFGKMLLTALGYDSAREGYTGAGWQKNVYAKATALGVFDGTESFGACDRETAARMALGAVQAKVVVYGDALVNGNYYWNNNKVTLIGVGIVKDQALETTQTLGDFYGVYRDETKDIFDRPGHTWEYGSWSKFYMDTPVAEYTTKVGGCDILVDCGIAKTSTAGVDVSEFVNSIDYDGGRLDHKYCDNWAFGGQGVLTQVFAMGGNDYRITEIDTYLAEVVDVKAAEHGKIGNEAKLAVYYRGSASDESATYATIYVEDITGLTKGDYILVNIALDVDDYGEVQDYISAEDYSIYSKEFAQQMARSYQEITGSCYLNVVGSAKTFEGKLTAVTKPESMALTIGGKSYPAARQYELSESFLELGATQIWFVDQYGNVIGDVDTAAAAVKYGRIDAIKWVNDGVVNTPEYASANLVTAEGSTVNQSAIAVSSWGKTLTGCDNGVPVVHETVSEVQAKNGAYYVRENNYGVVEYTGDGSVVKTTGEPLYQDGKNSNLTLTNKQVELGKFSSGAAVYADNDTQFLVYLGDGEYKAYLGISELPTMELIEGVIVVVEDTAAPRAYADFVFVNLPGVYAGATTEAYVFSAKPVAVEGTTGSETYTYNVWVNGEESTIVSKNGNLFDEANFKAGLYDITFNADNVARSATACTHYSKSVVADAERNGAIDDWYVVGATVYKVGDGKIEAYTTAQIGVGDTILVKGTGKTASVIYVTNVVEQPW